MREVTDLKRVEVMIEIVPIQIIKIENVEVLVMKDKTKIPDRNLDFLFNYSQIIINFFDKSDLLIYFIKFLKLFYK